MTAIVTKRLLLIPGQCSTADLKTQVGWLNDKELMQYSEQRHRHHDYVGQCNYIDSFIPPSMFYRITTGDQMIGTITAHVDKHNLVADMGILIGDKTKHGQGYGTEAWAALMEHLFGAGMRKVTGGCMSINRPMILIFRKTNMEKEGRRSKQFILGDYPAGAHMISDMDLWAKFNDGVH